MTYPKQHVAKARLVVFGRGGDTVHLSRDCTVYGYGTPDRPHAAEPRPDREFPDGCPVVDVRNADLRWALRGPMVDVDLGDDEIDPCPVPSAALREGVTGGFATLLALQEAHNSPSPGPLDSVSIRVFVEGWKRHGARVGEYRGGCIVWHETPA